MTDYIQVTDSMNGSPAIERLPARRNIICPDRIRVGELFRVCTQFL